MGSGNNWKNILSRPWIWAILIIGVVAAYLISMGQNTPTPIASSDLIQTATTEPTPTATAILLPTITPTELPPRPENTASPSSVLTYTYQIVNIYPHDQAAFTQGLIFTDDIFYEGTGLHGQSSLRKVSPETGEVLQSIPIPEQFFAEGITVFDDQVIQLTWQSNIGFVYDKDSFTLQREFSYPTEGWGITHDGQQLIMSDGTANLYFLNPETFEETGRVQVHDKNGPVIHLNELEYINGEVYANIWKTHNLARINPKTGEVVGWVDLSGLLQPEDYSQGQIDVLNGIAYDAQTDRLFVTGKWWPKLFEIELIPVQ